MSEELPAFIQIMPDYGPCYASDEDGCVFDISGIFENHTNIESIKDIEDRLYGIASWIDSGAPDEDPGFPWSKVDSEALQLAKKLSLLLGDIGIPIVYKSHYNKTGTRKEVNITYSKIA